MNLFERALAHPALDDVFSDAALVRAMLQFEAALALGQAQAGLIPQAAADVIASTCETGSIDAQALVVAARNAGSLAIPLVQQLTKQVAARSPSAAAFVHLGSTSQDVQDTAMVLATRNAHTLIDAELTALISTLLALAKEHAATPMLGRTLLQPASLISFGWKCAVWAAPLLRGRDRLRSSALVAFQLQLGGAVGNLAAYGDRAQAVFAATAQQLNLRHEPHCNWHTARDEWLSYGSNLALVCGSLGKLAQDFALLAQAEVGELSEASSAGRGASSAMPHKRNPVACMTALAATARAPQLLATLLACMPQAHERALGQWQAELAVWPQLVTVIHAAQVHAARMQANIDAQNGMVFAENLALALTPTLGKQAAHAEVAVLCQMAQTSGQHLHTLAQQAPFCSAIHPTSLDSIFSSIKTIMSNHKSINNLIKNLEDCV
jgi:3-carboxy-cis,cis-muconate cycloisomerase